MGDFNAHSQTWGCRDNRHANLLRILFSNRIFQFYIQVPQLIFIRVPVACLPLIFLCDPSLFMDLSWSVDDNLCSSDHFPVLVRSSQKDDLDAVPAWKMDRLHWPAFSDTCSKELTWCFLYADVPLRNYSPPPKSSVSLLLKILTSGTTASSLL